MILPNLVYHADWSTTDSKRWLAYAILAADGNFLAHEPQLVGATTKLLERFRADVGEAGIVFAGFDFPIGVPQHYARCAGIARFRDMLCGLGKDVWRDFFSVCDEPDEVSVFRPFYPNRSLKGHSRKHLLDGLHAADFRDLLRICERGSKVQRQACSLFWTLGGNQVGKAAITGWRDVLIPDMQSGSLRLWPFDGSLADILQRGHTVIAETYPAECYNWFDTGASVIKSNLDSRKKFGTRLLQWADQNQVNLTPKLRDAIDAGFPDGKDDAFDAVVGLFGMLKVCLGQRESGEPLDQIVREIEGWILCRRLR